MKEKEKKRRLNPAEETILTNTFRELGAITEPLGLTRAQEKADMWASFPGWLIDNCEGEIITEEFLQQQVANLIEARKQGRYRHLDAQNVVTDGPSQPEQTGLAPCPFCGCLDLGKLQTLDTEQVKFVRCNVCRFGWFSVADWNRAKQPDWAEEFADMVTLLMVSCSDVQSWHEAKALLERYAKRVPSLQSTSSTQPTEGRASAEGELINVLIQGREAMRQIVQLANLNPETREIIGGMGTKFNEAIQQAQTCLPNIDTQRGVTSPD